MQKIAFFFLFAHSFGALMAQDNCPVPLAPAPRLFYMQRTGSPDTIVYDANTAPDGSFRQADPVLVYWRRVAKKERQALNYLQRTKAYGVKFTPSEKAGEYAFYLVSFPQRPFRLTKDDCGQPVAMMRLGDKESCVQRIYIHLEPAAFGLKPTIHYIEIFGIDLDSGAPVYEKVVP